MTYREKVQEWFEREKREKGLLDFKVTPGVSFDNMPPVTREEKDAAVEEACRVLYMVLTGETRTTVNSRNERL